MGTATGMPGQRWTAQHLQLHHQMQAQQHHMQQQMHAAHAHHHHQLQQMQQAQQAQAQAPQQLQGLEQSMPIQHLHSMATAMPCSAAPSHATAAPAAAATEMAPSMHCGYDPALSSLSSNLTSSLSSAFSSTLSSLHAMLPWNSGAPADAAAPHVAAIEGSSHANGRKRPAHPPHTTLASLAEDPAAINAYGLFPSHSPSKRCAAERCAAQPPSTTATAAYQPPSAQGFSMPITTATPLAPFPSMLPKVYSLRSHLLSLISSIGILYRTFLVEGLQLDLL